MSDAIAIVAFGFFGLLAFFALLLVSGIAFFWKRQKTVKESHYTAVYTQPNTYQLQQMPQLQPVCPFDDPDRQLAMKVVIDRIVELCKCEHDTQVKQVSNNSCIDGYQIWVCPCGRKNLQKGPNEAIQCHDCMKFNIGIALVSEKIENDSTVAQKKDQ